MIFLSPTILGDYIEPCMHLWQEVVPLPDSNEQEAVLLQNCLSAASSTQCQVGLVPDFVFWFLCVFGLLFDENEVYF